MGGLRMADRFQGPCPFDAFFMLDNLPTRLQFNTFATGTDFIPVVKGEGSDELEYAVLSEDFPEARASFLLNLGTSPDSTSLVPKNR
jgi:hypothetical protein